MQVAICTPIQWVLFAGLVPGGDRWVVLGMAGAGTSGRKAVRVPENFDLKEDPSPC